LPQTLLQQLASAHRSRECLEGIKQGLAFSNTARREKHKLVMPRSSGSEIQDCRPPFVGSTGLQVAGRGANAPSTKVASGNCNFYPGPLASKSAKQAQRIYPPCGGRRRRAQAEHGVPRPDDGIAARPCRPVDLSRRFGRAGAPAGAGSLAARIVGPTRNTGNGYLSSITSLRFARSGN
jgi:hypothetical protein